MIGKDRIERRVDRLTRPGCWLWTGAIDGAGYGAIKDKGRQFAAHRAAFAAFVGSIPDGAFVCHRCDVKACVNPDHLFLGTALDNMRDKVAKGRHVASSGERNGSAKLSVDKVARIREARGAQRDIAALFGVSQTLISQIKLRKIWRHL